MGVGTAVPGIERAALNLYQLYDIGDSIDLERARLALAAPSTRMRPVATRGASIDMPQPPLVVGMGKTTLPLECGQFAARIEARIYDLGILAICLTIALPERISWEVATDLLAEVQSRPHCTEEAFASAFKALRGAIAPALDRPSDTIRTEDYSILLIERLVPGGPPASTLARHPSLLQTALGERRTLSAAAASLATTLSYYEDDLILLTWTAAIVIEPDAAAREDATFLLEFANVQLLAFRSYDDQVERDLARIAPRIGRARRPHWWAFNATSVFLHEIHALIADTTGTSARVENALKVTEDVYWNRVYTAALVVLRVEAWRTGIAEALAVLRESAALLNDEAEVARSTFLEVLVIVLIALELVIAALSLHH